MKSLPRGSENRLWIYKYLGRLDVQNTASGKWWKQWEQWKPWIWTHPSSHRNLNLHDNVKSPCLVFGEWISCCLCLPTYPQLFIKLIDEYWWFRCRDVGQGISVLNPMPRTIPATSHLMLRVMLHRSKTRGIHKFTVPSLDSSWGCWRNYIYPTISPTKSNDYPNFIDPIFLMVNSIIIH